MIRELTEEEYLIVLMSPFSECLTSLNHMSGGKPVSIYGVKTTKGYQFSFGKYVLYASHKWKEQGQQDCYFYLVDDGTIVNVKKNEWNNLQLGKATKPIIIGYQSKYFSPSIIGWQQ